MWAPCVPRRRPPLSARLIRISGPVAQVCDAWHSVRSLLGGLDAEVTFDRTDSKSDGDVCLAVGVFDESVFQAIDYVLAQAARHNLKVAANCTLSSVNVLVASFFLLNELDLRIYIYT